MLLLLGRGRRQFDAATVFLIDPPRQPQRAEVQQLRARCPLWCWPRPLSGAVPAASEVTPADLRRKPLHQRRGWAAHGSGTANAGARVQERCPRRCQQLQPDALAAGVATEGHLLLVVCWRHSPRHAPQAVLQRCAAVRPQCLGQVAGLLLPVRTGGTGPGQRH